jgi:transposase InsO family protein
VISKYEFIDAMKALYPIVLMCLWAEVSKSGFYDWLTRPTSATAARRRELEVVITSIFEASDATYGYRRVHAELRAGQVQCSPEFVRAVMRDLGLYPCQPKPFRPTTTEAGDASDIPDLVNRDFTADVPGTKMVGDITYIPTAEGFTYLATVIDCCTKECIGYAIADHMRADLVCDALAMAARNYPLAEKAIFHSDRGTQYTSDEFAKAVKAIDARRSMGRTGNCFDNALAESFNAAVKVERVNRMRYATIEEAIRDVVRYIEFRYNRRRLHSALGYVTPRQAYENYINNDADQSAA